MCFSKHSKLVGLKLQILLYPHRSCHGLLLGIIREQKLTLGHDPYS